LPAPPRRVCARRATPPGPPPPPPPPRLGMPAQAVARLEDLVPCLATVGGE
jgi:hypothetical protein